MEDNSDGEEAGYARPPKKSRFQKGTSGNPHGRPKGSKNFETLVDQEMNQKVLINEGGKRLHVSKKHAIIKVLANKSLSGHDRALSTLLPCLEKLDEKKEQARAAAGISQLLEEDQEILKRFGLMEKQKDGS